jgi:glutamine synthetase
MVRRPWQDTAAACTSSTWACVVPHSQPDPLLLLLLLLCNAGLKQGLQLPPPVDGNQDDPSVTGRHPRLPASLPDSLAEYQKDTELQVGQDTIRQAVHKSASSCQVCQHV